MPSRLKFLKYPGTLTPLKKKVMIGTVRSRATPMLSPFLMNGWLLCEGSTIDERPPVHRLAPSKPKEKRSSPTPLPPHFSPPPGYGTYLSNVWMEMLERALTHL